MKTEPSNQIEEPHRDSSPSAKELLEQTQLLTQIRRGVEMDPCLLDKLGRIACLTANEVHQNTLHVKAVRQSLEALVEMYRTVNPAAALELDRQAALRAEIARCCPPEDQPELICEYEPCKPHGGVKRGDGYSVKSRGHVAALEVSEEHEFLEDCAATASRRRRKSPRGSSGRLRGADRAIGADAPAAGLSQWQHDPTWRSGSGRFQDFHADRPCGELAARYEWSSRWRCRADVG